VQYSFFSNFGNSRQKGNGWRLDYFIIDKNALNNLIDSEILPEYDGSDHVPIRLTWKNN